MNKFIIILICIALVGCQQTQKPNQQNISEQSTQSQETQETQDNTTENLAENHTQESVQNDTTQHTPNKTPDNSAIDLSFGETESKNSARVVQDNTHNSSTDLQDHNQDDKEETIALEEKVDSQMDEKTDTFLETPQDNDFENTKEIDPKDADFENGDLEKIEETDLEAVGYNDLEEMEDSDLEEMEDSDLEEMEDSDLEKETSNDDEQRRLAEQQEQERQAKIKAEQERQAKIKAEQERQAKIKAEQEKKRFWNSLLAKKGTYNYDIYIDKAKTGTQVLKIIEKNGAIIVKLDVSINISKWYYSYKFTQRSTEVWRNDIPQSYDCFQDDNGTKTNLSLNLTSGKYTMKYNGKTSNLQAPLIPGTSWCLMEMYEKYSKFLVVDGGEGTTITYSKSQMKSLGEKNIKVGNTSMRCKHFKPEPNKKVELWYSNGIFVRYTDVVDGYPYDTILTSVSK